MQPCWNNSQRRCLQLEAPSPPPATLPGSGPAAEDAPGAGGWHGPGDGVLPQPGSLWGARLGDGPQRDPAVALGPVVGAAGDGAWSHPAKPGPKEEQILAPLAGARLGASTYSRNNIILIPVSQMRAAGRNGAGGGGVTPQSLLFPPVLPCVHPNGPVSPRGR